MCLLLALGQAQRSGMGQDRAREIYRALVYELLNWRDAQRELKSLIKARYRAMGRAPAGWAKGIFPNDCARNISSTCWGRGAANALCASTLSTITRLAVEGNPQKK